MKVSKLKLEEEVDEYDDIKTSGGNRLLEKNATILCRSSTTPYYVGAFVAIMVVVAASVVLLLKDAKNAEEDDIASSIDPLLVATQFGLVRGFYLTNLEFSPNSTLQTNSTVLAWRGIPFASPPIGDHRWMPPTEPSHYGESPLDCTQYRSVCVQSTSPFSGSEDCLYLNVYTTDPVFDSSAVSGLWPVFVYIYGGGMMAGENRDDFSGLIYSNVKRGTSSVEHSGLVVVELAYRVNLFGFLATSELSQEQGGHSGNYGILDQIMALTWVKNNIAAFNGDPNNVIICGQSSGGTSIFALMSSPLSAGLFHGAISMSGSPNITIDMSAAERQNAPIVNSSGCNQTGFSFIEVNSCMRNLSSYEVYQIIPINEWNTPGLWGMPMYGGMNYQGLVIVDGSTVAQPFNSALQAGLVDVPLIFGNMACEPDEDPDVNVQGYTLTQWQAFLNESFSQWGSNVGIDMYNLYLNDAKVNPQKAYDSIVSDYGLYCGQIEIALNASQSASSRRKSNIYIYYDEWALAKPFVESNSVSSSYVVQFPFHDVFYFMLTNQWARIGNGSYIPTSEDFAAQAIIQENFWSMALNGEPSKSWLPVAEINNTTAESGWYSIYSINSQTGQGQSMPNYRQDICQYYKSIGLTSSNFWWVN